MTGSARWLQPAPGSYQVPPEISGDHPAIQDESISDGKIKTSESDKPFTCTADEPSEYQVLAEPRSQTSADRVTHARERNGGGQQHATASSIHSCTPQEDYDAESEPSIIESDDDSMVGSELDMLPQVFLDDPLEDRHVVPLVTVSFDLSEASSVRDPMGFLDEARELLRLIQESRSRSRARNPDRGSRSMYTQSTVTDTESWVDLAVEGKVDVTQITQLKPRDITAEYDIVGSDAAPRRLGGL
ncbi:hypothetical protein FOMPIDRAFT_1056394 [Fomitopsis schrenkii]|uniref:Uncharacterized protein n=1 Tax=Fomitopsis schrenkii TaxID=2126942 RepID=S8DJE5_FOMSC|nr:hypothetical protein FOMPIDRAFT_1056394 [Fomitopsis schrenkii]